jgi:hypothetical protein
VASRFDVCRTKERFKVVSSFKAAGIQLKSNHPDSLGDLPDTPRSACAESIVQRSIEEVRYLRGLCCVLTRALTCKKARLKPNYIREGLKKGTFQFSQYAWHVGMPQWMRIGDLREFDRRSYSKRDIGAAHVPPPLPDPISAVLLEDDGDFESEEFHVNLKPSKFDATPTDPMMLFSAGKESVAVGGAAAKIFEPSSQDLARVPWEERIPAAGDQSVVAQAVELIDDESSFAGYPEHESVDNDEVVEAHLDSYTPQPFIPSAVPVAVREEDGWEKWGRYAAAVCMGAVTAVFSGHLLTYESSASAAHLRRSAERAQIGTSASPKKSVDAPAEIEPLEPTITLTVPPVVPSQAQDAVPVSQTSGNGNDTGIDMGDPMAGPEGGLPSSPLVAEPVIAPSPAIVPAPRAQIAMSGNNSSLEASIVGLKLTSPDAQVLFQGAFPTGQPLVVTFRGRLGEVLSKLNVRKTITINRSGAEIPSVKLKEIGLPDGAYTVEVSAGKTQLKSDLFLGKRMRDFLIA